MAPKKKKEAASGSKVAAAAAANVEGYLLNASRRQRVPLAEGGRGTRRRMAMVTALTAQAEVVTSADTVAGQHGGASTAAATDATAVSGEVQTAASHASPVLDADDDEWDDIPLPATVVNLTKSEGDVVKEEERGRGAAKSEAATHSKAEPTEATPITRSAAAPGVKAEPVIVDDEEGADSANIIAGGAGSAALKHTTAAVRSATSVTNVKQEPFGGADVMAGSRAPLTGQERRPWGARDAEYEEAQQQKDALTAARRADRMHRVFFGVTNIMVLMMRLQFLWRQAHHPVLLRRLLRLPALSSCSESTPKARSASPPRKRPRTEIGNARAATAAAPEKDAATESKRRHPLLEAVRTAKGCYATARSTSQKKALLAPVWVNHNKDGAKNHTSAAIRALITALNEAFTLPPEGNDSGRSEGSAGVPASNASAVAAANAVENDAETSAEKRKAEAAALAKSPLAAWDAPLETQTLFRALTIESGASGGASVRRELASPIYFSVLFVSLARLAQMRCRLVLAMRTPYHSFAPAPAAAELPEDAQPQQSDGENEEGQDGNSDSDEDVGIGVPSRRSKKLQPLKLELRVAGAKKKTTAGGDGPAATSKKTAQETVLVSRKLPSACVWVEVWCPQRSCYISVNPCAGCTTLWGAPYTFAYGGDTGVADVTARYTSRYSDAFSFGGRLGQCRNFGFLWKERISWEESHREVSDVLVEDFNKALFAGRAGAVSAEVQLADERETKQLELLRYSEPVPTTLIAVSRNPLFVLERDLARFEAVYPKDATSTVGTVRGHLVYKRSAVVSLRSRDGWLREGRCVRPEEEASPYKLVPPPASRPFAPASPFFGVWQTQPFQPLPLTAEGTIPLHGRTSWYALLSCTPPPGIVHLRQPQIVRVARRMNLELGLALTGFVRKRVSEMRRGHWEAVLDGIVVKAADAPALLHAYEEWVQLTQEQEAAKRRERAFRWWMLFSQRLLAMARLQQQYASGLRHGGLPTA